MKRLHVHVGVHDLKQSIRFYSALFASDHLGLQTDGGEELEEIGQRGNGNPLPGKQKAACCA